MTSVAVKDLKGKEVGTKELAAEVFAIEPNMSLVHSSLVRQLANARSGSANTKTRAEVRGGGRKPWRQKGTGRARAGSIRSPLWNGGGVIFGPKPRDFSKSMPRKARQLAIKSALAARANELVLVNNFDGLFSKAPKAGEAVTEQPKTKAMVETLKSLGIAEKKVLIVLDHMVAGAHQVAKAARNLPNVRVIDQKNLNVKDLASCQALLTTEQVLHELENRFKNCGSKNPCQKAGSEEAVTKAVKAEKPAKAKAETEAAVPAKAPAKKAEAKAAEAKTAEAKTEDEPKAAKKPAAKKAAPEADAAPKKPAKKKSEEA